MSERGSDVLSAAAVGLAVALVVILLARLLMELAGRRWPMVRRLHRWIRTPFRVLVVVVALHPALTRLREGLPDERWGWLAQTERVLLIVAIGWLCTSAALFVEDLGLRRYRTDVPDNQHARRLRTQVLIIRRLTVAVGVVIIVGAALLSFPGARTVGASLLASAGVISIVAALAAQSTLANVFAGLQLAFSDAVRLDDVVVVEEEWGWIEEITLSYVVVRAWDDRRLVLPCTYFTTTPFQNWTRHASELLGSVELDLDWGVDTGAMRAELDRVLETTDLWDGRVKVLQVTDAVGGWVRVRALVTARDAAALFDLRCLVRERLVTWVRAHAESGLPRQRVQVLETDRPRRVTRVSASEGLFHGSPEAEERATRAGGQNQADEQETPTPQGPTDGRGGQ
jgi:small-conductance mechanosensitive channel